MSALELGCRGLLVAILGVAAASKLGRGALAALVDTLAAFGLPRRLQTRFVASLVVAGEATAASLLVIAPRAGYALCGALLATFTLGLAHVLRSARPVACRCFGASQAPVRHIHVVRNVGLIAVAVLGALLHELFAGPGGWPGAVIGALLGVVITQWDELAGR